MRLDQIGQIGVVFATLEGHVSSMRRAISFTQFASRVTGITVPPLGIYNAVVTYKADFDGRVAETKYQLDRWKLVIDEVTSRQTIEGRAATEEDGLQILEGLKKHAELWSGLASLAAYLSVVETAKRGFFITAQQFVDFAKDVSDLINLLFRALKTNAETALTLLDYLPWIVAALVLGPSILRTISAGRRGGANAAFDTAAGELDSGRRSAGDLARKGYRAARRATVGV